MKHWCVNVKPQIKLGLNFELWISEGRPQLQLAIGFVEQKLWKKSSVKGAIFCDYLPEMSPNMCHYFLDWCMSAWAFKTSILSLVGAVRVKRAPRTTSSSSWRRKIRETYPAQKCLQKWPILMVLGQNSIQMSLSTTHRSKIRWKRIKNVSFVMHADAKTWRLFEFIFYFFETKI